MTNECRDHLRSHYCPTCAAVRATSAGLASHHLVAPRATRVHPADPYAPCARRLFSFSKHYFQKQKHLLRDALAIVGLIFNNIGCSQK